MKNKFILAILSLSLFMAGCGSASKTAENHSENSSAEHAHDEHDHAGHDHAAESGDEHATEHKGETANEIVFSPEQAAAVGLTTETVAPADFTDVITVGGEIVASQGDQATVAATSAGIVSFASGVSTEGAAVTAGQTIVTLSSSNLPDGDPAQRARSEYESARREYERTSALVKDRIVSQKQYEQAEQRYQNARNAYEAVGRRMNGRGVAVTSPISGYITARFVSQGDYVAVGQPIAAVSQNRRLQLRAELPERHFGQIRNISSANFKLSYDSHVYRLDELNGRLVSRGRMSADGSFYIPVTFEFDNRGDIAAGAYAEVYLLSTPLNNITSVPVSALTEEQGLNFVYVQIDDECYRKQEVKIGRNNGSRVEILSGLSAGDKVVTVGVYQVKLAALSSIIPEGHSHNH